MKASLLFVAIGLTTVVAVASTQTPQHEHPATTPERLGAVHFTTTCAPAVQPKFDRAMALLHSFEFSQAIEGFETTLTGDATCGIAAWGIAMSRWGNPFNASPRPAPQIALGLAAVQRAQQIGAKSERERAYIAAVATLYVDADKRSQRERQVAYADAMAKLSATYATDREASIFYALSLTASAPPADKTYANQLKAAAILEKLAPLQPNHPGISHYIIHTYDVPALADRALVAARRYAGIAPSAPHALHMPSHTFTRVGAWQESITTNTASAATAKKLGAVSEELHATDYMAYAYLQTAQDAAAERVLQSLPEIVSRFDPTKAGSAAPGSAGVFALAAIPARWALERRDWAGAAALEPKESAFPYTEAMTYLARALGAAHVGKLDDARSAAAALDGLREKLTRANEAYWAEQVRIQHDEAAAFLALAEGRSTDALALLRAAAVREDATEKNAVTPGPLAPARELLGEMLLEMKQPAAALVEFQAVMKKEPHRFRAVYGAAKAAQLSGNAAAARAAYTELVSICQKADKPGRAELLEAREFLKKR